MARRALRGTEQNLDRAFAASPPEELVGARTRPSRSAAPGRRGAPSASIGRKTNKGDESLRRPGFSISASRSPQESNARANAAERTDRGVGGSSPATALVSQLTGTA
jgi:hypothetical protein